ncbi:MAG: class I SAM-dependent methyltransferase [Rhodocyclaceae bacterium]|nr:class I SAM-dependent methyltransferase [Rhodocyclaceae bacterium]
MTVLENSLRASALPGSMRGAAPLVGRLRRSTRLAVELLDRLEGCAVRLALPGQGPLVLGNGPVQAQWTVRDEAVFERIFACGDIALGETYMDGLWSCDELASLLTLLSANRRVLHRAIHGRRLAMLGHWLRHRLRANSRSGSRRNIEAHYDLGNDFYALWLDRSMSYSSALYAAPDESLAAAQQRKLERVLERLDPKPGETLLEIGCGWGGLAELAATTRGCRVLGLTLSKEQLDYARRRAQRGGFSHLAEFALCDYRDVRGRYDHIVSIEMVEAVGERYWPVWFAQLRERLAPGGRALVQSITIDEGLFETYRRSTDFIQRYIFPGGMLPTPSRFGAEARSAGLDVRDDFAFGPHYARTLQQWRERFDLHPEALREKGYDDRFQRMWRFYLAYCEAGFASGDLDVHQFELGHAA